MASDEEIKPKKASRAQTSMLVWVLMAMLITGLGGFGVTNFGRSVNAVGSVGDTEIEVNTYARALRGRINELSRQFGQQLGMNEARMLGLDQQVLSGLIANAALDNEAARLGLSVGDMTVAKRVAAEKAFQDITGKFSLDTYKQVLEQAGMTVREYETGTRADTARGVLQAAVVGGFVAPAALADTLFAYNGEKRSFRLVQFIENTLPFPVAPATDAELQAYYDAHLPDFTRAEAKRITYAILTPDTLAPSQPVDEAEIAEIYNTRLADYVVPEKRLVERLVYPSDAEAAAAKAKLDAGTSFETLVTERGLELTDIDLGDVTKSELGAAGDAVFGMTEPGIVGPLASDLGPALFRMNAVIAAQETKLADIRDTLAAELQKTEAVKAISTLSSDVDDALAGGATLEDLVKDHGMTLVTTDFVAGADDNDPVALDRVFVDVATKLTADDYPEAHILSDGGLIAMRLDEVVPPTPVPLDKIRDKVAAAHHADAVAKALTAQATAAEAAIKSGATLDAQGTVKVLENLTRDATPEGATPDVMKAVFTMKAGDLRLLDRPDFVGLIELTAVTPADLAAQDTKAARDQLAQQVQQSIAQDAYDLYTAAMTAQGKLTIDQSVITSVQAQMN